MDSLILLADQERLVKLFSTLNEKPGITVRVISDIEILLSAPPARGPRCIAIQDRLGEVAGEILAQRLTTQFKGRRTKLVLLGSTTELTNFGKQPAMVAVDPNLPADQLLSIMEELLATGSSRGSGKQRQQGKKTTKQHSRPDTQPVAVDLPPVADDEVADIVTFNGAAAGNEVSASTPQADSDPHPEQSAFAATLDSALSAQEETKGTQDPANDHTDLVTLSPSAKPCTPATAPVPDREYSAPAPPAPRRRLTRKALIVGALLAGLGALVLSLPTTSEHPPSDRNGTSGKKAAAPTAPLVSLPAFIPASTADTSYAKSNPGWERYGGNPVEFRVFREAGTITAIQVFDRSDAGLPGSLFTAALTELSGSSRYLVERTEQQGAYQVERGRLGNGKGIIIYRTASPRQVRAFVIDLR